MSEDYRPKQAAIQTQTVETFVFKADHVHCVDHYGAFHWSGQEKKTSIQIGEIGPSRGPSRILLKCLNFEDDLILAPLLWRHIPRHPVMICTHGLSVQSFVPSFSGRKCSLKVSAF